MRHWRYTLLAIFALSALVALASSANAAKFDYGCCLRPLSSSSLMDACIPGDPAAFGGSASTFQSYCSSNGGQLVNDNLALCQSNCSIGCCCASPVADPSGAINSTNDKLAATQWGCMQQNTLTPGYSFRVPAAGADCVQTCGGRSTGPVGGTTYTISGYVRNGTIPLPANVTFFAFGAQGNTTTDANGFYTKTLPANQQYIVTAVPRDPSCTPKQLTLMLNANKNNQNFAISCGTSQTCTNAAPAVQNLTIVRYTSSATFNISYGNRCNDFDSFTPAVCEGKTGSCNWLPNTRDTYVTVNNLQPNTEYCFYVRANQNPTGHVDGGRTAACITSGDAQCVNRQGSWCDGDAVLSCDDKNKLTTQQCNQGASTVPLTCTMTSQGARCTEKVECAKCNGLLGLFAKLNIRIPIDGPLRACSQAQQCYLEQSFVPAYNTCDGVKGCTNYTSASSCAADRCGIGSCAWKGPQDNASRELGAGLCVSANESVTPPCKQCEAAFGRCDAQLCRTISDNCYYDGVTSAPGVAPPDSNGWAPQGCIPKQEMACRFYDNQADCGNAAIDIQYNASGARVGGTNRRTPSTDRFGFGDCQWIANATTGKNYCVKNGDSRFWTTEKEDDCSEAGLRGTERDECFRDHTAPVTQMILKSPAVYGSSEINTLPVTVTDDSRNVTTLFCISNGTQCYPSKRLSSLSVPDVDASYTLYFYSYDNHYNFEEVKSVPIQVRKDNVTRLYNITIEENT